MARSPWSPRSTDPTRVHDAYTTSRVHIGSGRSGERGRWTRVGGGWARWEVVNEGLRRCLSSHGPEKVNISHFTTDEKKVQRWAGSVFMVLPLTTCHGEGWRQRHSVIARPALSRPMSFITPSANLNPFSLHYIYIYIVLIRNISALLIEHFYVSFCSRHVTHQKRCTESGSSPLLCISEHFNPGCFYKNYFRTQLPI